MKVQSTSNHIKPEPSDLVTLTVAGNVKEIRFSKAPAGSPIRKVDKEHGVDIRTGEVVEYQHNANRAGNKASVAQSLKHLRGIINANLENPDNALWVTLTYADLMTDEKRLYTDFHAFWKRFLRYQKRENQTPALYISCAEPQARGAWHLHLILLFLDRAPFIPNADMAQLWRHGFTKVKSLRTLENPGLYLTAYLGDMELAEAAQAGTMSAKIKEVDVASEDGTPKKKSIVKGGRLPMYPSGFNLFRTSRGIKRPTVSTMTEKEAQKIVGDTPLTYEKTIQVVDGAGKVRNTFYYRTYNKKPAKNGIGTPTDEQVEPGNADVSKQGH